MSKKETKITRGINECFARAIVASDLYNKLYLKHKEKLFWGVRNGYVNLYYDAASVCKVTYNSRKDELICEVAKKYIYGEGKYGKKPYETVSVNEIVDKYEDIISEIRSKNTDEKKAQQELIHKNNSNAASKWFCIDIEYIKQRKSKNDTKYGRFDIVAISKTTPYTVALIELKYGSKAIGGKSGVVKHAEDYISFLEDRVYKTHMKAEIVDVVKSLNMLNVCQLKIENIDDLAEKPEFFFITLNNKNNAPYNTMRRYLFDGVKGAYPNTVTVEKKLGIDITNNTIGFIPTFLFSADRIGEITITDIINGNYNKRGISK